MNDRSYCRKCRIYHEAEFGSLMSIMAVSDAIEVKLGSRAYQLEVYHMPYWMAWRLVHRGVEYSGYWSENHGSFGAIDAAYARTEILYGQSTPSVD